MIDLVVGATLVCALGASSVYVTPYREGVTFEFINPVAGPPKAQPAFCTVMVGDAPFQVYWFHTPTGPDLIGVIPPRGFHTDHEILLRRGHVGVIEVYREIMS